MLRGVEHEKSCITSGPELSGSFVRLGIEGLLVPDSPPAESLVSLSKTFYPPLSTQEDRKLSLHD